MTTLLTVPAAAPAPAPLPAPKPVYIATNLSSLLVLLGPGPAAAGTPSVLWAK